MNAHQVGISVIGIRDGRPAILGELRIGRMKSGLRGVQDVLLDIFRYV